MTEEWIASTVEWFSSEDDVFRKDFLNAVLITCSKKDGVDLTTDAKAYLQSLGADFIRVEQIGNESESIAPGPYIYYDGSLHSHREPFKLRTAGAVPQTLTVAVPTRIQSKIDTDFGSERPLAGWRIAIKDNFQIKNVRTSACNRAYYALHPPPSKTAICIQTLYDAGAAVVGTTKLASFAATEEPMQCIDWSAPWNPRADGHQSPAGSSSGSGAAVAAYSWLDVAIGSDTSGSGRRPGHWNGCFAMRPSHGYLSHDGFLKSFPRFDVPTVFGRDLERCKKFAKIWYGQNLPPQLSLPSKPFRVVYSTDYMKLIDNERQLELIDGFIGDLEQSLAIEHERVSFDDLWESNPPAQAKGKSLQTFMKDASRDSFFYEDYHNFGPFRHKYRATFDKNPYISPPVRWQWALSSTITKAANEEALRRLEVYKRWFEETVMRPDEQSTLVLIPIEEISPRYRNELPTSHFNPVGVPNLFLSPILKAPELTVPIGEYEFQSKVSGNKEKLPVAISIIGSPGQDLHLFDVALDCLRKAHRSTHVLAGKTLFPSSERL